MPIDYFAIMKQAYTVTLKSPGLWLLGLFMSGGFNANFVYWANLHFRWRDRGDSVLDWLQLSRSVPHIALGVAAGLIIFAGVLIVTNWVKILFILRTSDLLDLQRMRPQTKPNQEPMPLIQESQRYMAPTVA